ncbi:hypothetical protein BXZ70DRAFT_448689 [Cristinia sonorae]|uniref:DUF3295 domain-containing protein n=1 Tax=Cristinia sonorae TaxID=1940300 RepID=A0A8K0UI10_9AGAR|nr:hypothetical protein BXZ70DRAFT_448689 [Cristinia sonorae]
MPARPQPKSAPRAGKFIIEILPDTLNIPPRSSKPTERNSSTSGTPPSIPTVVANTAQATTPPQRPVITVPSNTTSPSHSLGFPSVVVVNPTPHPTPPATPQALRPVVPGAPAFPAASTHLFPPPAKRPLYGVRQPAPPLDAQPQAPALSVAAPNPASAQQSPSKPSGQTPPPASAPSPSPSSNQPPTDETLKASDRRFFLQQSESPDERSPDAESPLASTSKLSDTHSPSSEASSQMKTNITQGARRATAFGKARARKSRETVRHVPVRPMTGRAQAQRQAQGAQRKATTEPKKAAFNIGSTSSNGSRGTAPVEQAEREVRQPSREKPRARPASPVKDTRSNGQPPAQASNGKANGNGNSSAAANRRGIVVSDSDFETTESDDDSEWASEETDEQELARRREETRLRQAAEEAQRQRDMFAKVPKRSYTDLNRTRSGLLSQLLNPDPSMFPPGYMIPTSFSSQDMTQLGRTGRPGAPSLPTSKSSAAVPLAANVNAQSSAATTTTNSSGYRPKGRPQAEMEYDSDSGDETGDNGIQVPRSLAQQKLAALADPNRRRHSERNLPSAAPAPQPTALPTVATAPIALGYPYNLPAPALPMTPRTTRRQMLATELSESLRRNLLWERQVSKINMAGGARRGGLLGGGLRPLTAVNQEATTSANGNTNGRSNTRTSSGAAEKDERKRAAMARNKSWGDDYHTSGW